MSVENENRNIMNKNIMEAITSAEEMLNNNNDNCECKEQKREEMLKKIKCLKFAIIELAQYLDTHPEDEKAICLHNRYCKELKELEDKYQKKYGPLTIYFPCNKWRWIEEPWPWEGGID